MDVNVEDYQQEKGSGQESRKFRVKLADLVLDGPRKAALAAYDQFIASYQAKYPRATDCLEKDKEWLFTFYDFPAQHWSHLRTTNPIESTFATVRLRTQRTKGCGSRIATLTMVFKLGIEAQKHWRRLNGSALLPKVVTVSNLSMERNYKNKRLNCY
jgi:putative transposase